MNLKKCLKTVEPHACHFFTPPKGNPPASSTGLGMVKKHRHLQLGREGFSISFLIRMIYSLLVDADFIDTETFFGKNVKKDVKTTWKLYSNDSTPLSENSPPKKRYRNQFLVDKTPTMVYAKSLDELTGLFSLTVPTGGQNPFLDGVCIKSCYPPPNVPNYLCPTIYRYYWAKRLCGGYRQHSVFWITFLPISLSFAQIAQHRSFGICFWWSPNVATRVPEPHHECCVGTGQKLRV